MNPEQLVALRAEIDGDPAGLGYADVPEDPQDSGARHVGMHALLHAVNRSGAALATAPAEAIIAAFAPAEWAAAKALRPEDAVIDQWFDRLMARREPVSLAPGGTFRLGLAYLVTHAGLAQERADAIATGLGAGAPLISRAQEIGLAGVTTSDIADALRL